MLFRDDRQMAINDVEALCAEAADHYATAAARVQDAALAALFAELAPPYGQFAAALAQHIRADGDLPQQPDPDQEAMADVLTGLKGLLRGDLRSARVDERRGGERARARAAHAALAHDVPPPLHELLQAVRAQAEAAGLRLAAARASLP